MDMDCDVPLCKAVKFNDWTAVCDLLDAGAEVNMCQKNGDPPLFVAVRYGHLEIVCKLLEYGADVTACWKGGNTALLIAARHGHLELVLKLLEAGADIKKQNKDGDTPLHLAAENGHLEIVNTLINHTASIDNENENGYTPLHLAAEKGHLKTVCKLIEHKADINNGSNSSYTPLCLAAKNGHVGVVCKLINLGADVNGAGTYHQPLLMAAKHGHLECVRHLIENGSDINLICIFAAIRNNHFEISQKMLIYVSTFKLDESTKLLKWVTMNNEKQMVNMFTANRSVLIGEYEEFRNLTILEIACYQWANVVKWNTIKLLLEYGANPKRTFPLWQNKSAIHFATMGQNPDILEGLASEEDVEVNAIAHGQNALLLLINNGNPDMNFEKCVQILCEKQIDIQWSNEQNKSAIICAAEKKYINIVNLLLTKIPCVTSEEDAVLKSIIGELGSYTVCDFEPTVHGSNFLKNSDEDGFISWMKTPYKVKDTHQYDSSFLQLACEKNLEKVVRYLIKDNPNEVGRTDLTHPLIIAVRNGHSILVELILSADNLETPPNLLSEALKRVHIKSNQPDVNYQNCCELILAKNEFDVNNCYEDTAYPLHYAVRYAGPDIVSRLLLRKASLANRDESNHLTIKGIDHDTLKKHFDSCITHCSKDTKTMLKDILSFDYISLLPTLKSPATQTNKDTDTTTEVDIVMTDASEKRIVAQKETDAILEMTLDDKQRPLLQHPLIGTFLNRKWHKVRFLFWFNFIAYFTFCILLWCFISSNYNEVNDVPIDAVYVLLGITTVIILLREIFQAVFRIWTYLTNTDNYFEVALLVDVFGLLIFPTTMHNRQPMFAIAALLSAQELLFLIGRAPGLSTYIIMTPKPPQLRKR